MTELDLRFQYVDRSWGLDFPDAIDDALEEDFLANSEAYSEEVFKVIRAWLLIVPDMEPEQLIEKVHEFAEKRALNSGDPSNTG